VELYTLYQSRLKTLNACDFGDLTLHVLELFQNCPDVLARYHRQFRYLLVDEYQDTNVIQYLWLRLLAQVKPNNICCVGDDDQSIYGWRGAEVGNILRFENDFSGAKVIRLERNYRSTGHILAAASGLIAHNESRLGKTLWTEDDLGEAVRLRGLWDGEAEARFVADEIEALQRKGHALSEMAILVRTGAQTREFEERFITVGLPYRVIGGPRFYERAEIRDALAYLRLVYQPDDGLAFERIVNKPKRGLGDVTLKQLHAFARARDISLSRAALDLVETDELRPAARRALAEFLEGLRRWRQAADGLQHCDLAELILDESGYTEMWQNDKSLDAPGRLENLKELIVAMEEFDTLGGFLEHVGLIMEAAENRDQDQINVMTLHSAKGLEFDTVFLAGWEEGLFPNHRALDETGLRGLEEERRLAYVGLTRARQRAIVSFAANRRLHGSWAAAIPSRFVDELTADAVEREIDPGLYGSAGGPGGYPGRPQSGALDGAAFAQWSESRGTPGMARARHRAEQGQPFIDVVPRVVESLAGGDLAAGARVFHQKFGYGTVRKVDGERLTIVFDRAGDKKVMASFVVPADQAG
jgi:DNA helicase-2/ATP-dependent DNA helicase PcrA